jgi:hypothetical protein
MALVNKFSQRQSPDLKSLYLFDKTGIYDPVSNPGGWSGSNPNTTDATSDTFIIEMVYPEPGPAYTVNAYPVLPNTTNQAFQVNNTDLGLSADDQIPDGQYKITRTTLTTTGSLSYTYTQRVFLIGQLQCCADQALSEEEPGCGCDSEKLSRASILQYTIFSLKKAFKAMKFEKANEIMKYAQALCKNKNCKNC